MPIIMFDNGNQLVIDEYLPALYNEKKMILEMTDDEKATIANCTNVGADDMTQTKR